MGSYPHFFICASHKKCAPNCEGGGRGTPSEVGRREDDAVGAGGGLPLPLAIHATGGLGYDRCSAPASPLTNCSYHPGTVPSLEAMLLTLGLSKDSSRQSDSDAAAFFRRVYFHRATKESKALAYTCEAQACTMWFTL